MERMIDKKAAAGLLAALLAASLVFTACGDDEGNTPNPPATWAAIGDSDLSGNIRNVAFGNGVFVATGDNGSAWVSSDAITWSPSTDKAALGADSIRGLTFGNGLFLATGGGSGNTVRAYSEDNGLTWVSCGTSAGNPKGLVYGAGKFLAGGGGSDGGIILYSATPKAAGSWQALDKDATTFNDASGQNYINTIAFGSGKFVAGGGNGQTAYSVNGTTWTAVTQTEALFGGSGKFIDGIAYGNGRFVAVGGSGTGNAAWSNNGSDWTAVVDSRVTGEINTITFGNGYFVLGARSDGSAAYSADGLTWTAIDGTAAIFSSGINGIAYGNGKFVMVGAGGKAAYSSVQ